MGLDPPALRGAEPGSRGAVSPLLRVEILGHLVAFRYLHFLKVVKPVHFSSGVKPFKNQPRRLETTLCMVQVPNID